jgi:hypothetical protein
VGEVIEKGLHGLVSRLKHAPLPQRPGGQFVYRDVCFDVLQNFSYLDYRPLLGFTSGNIGLKPANIDNSLLLSPLWLKGDIPEMTDVKFQVSPVPITESARFRELVEDYWYELRLLGVPGLCRRPSADDDVS